MKRFLTALALTLVAAAPAPAPVVGPASLPPDPEQLFQRAVASRADATSARSHFSAAAGHLDWDWGLGTRTPATAVNRGRAHFLAGNLPQAVRAFRDGLDLYPWDARLQRGLVACRAAVTYPSATDPAARVRPDPPAGLRHRLSPWDLFAAAAVGSLLLTVGLARRLTTADGWATPLAGVGLLGLVAVGAVGVLIDRDARRDRDSPVVVVATDTALRTGNGASYPPRVDAPLPRGAEVRLLGRRGGWAQVELPGGAVGWVPEAAVLNG